MRVTSKGEMTHELQLWHESKSGHERHFHLSPSIKLSQKSHDALWRVEKGVDLVAGAAGDAWTEARAGAVLRWEASRGW
jgi:hypothetical protein